MNDNDNGRDPAPGSPMAAVRSDHLQHVAELRDARVCLKCLRYIELGDGVTVVARIIATVYDDNGAQLGELPDEQSTLVHRACAAADDSAFAALLARHQGGSR